MTPTPFVFWLNKEEVDEMLTMLIFLKGTQRDNENVLNEEEVMKFTQDLLKQNMFLAKIAKKIQTMSQANKKKLSKYSEIQKCKKFQDNLRNMYTHCSVYNSKQVNAFRDIAKNVCIGCSNCEQSKSASNLA